MIDSSPSVTATAFGVRATCTANSSGTDAAADTGRVNTARFPIASRWASSAGSSTSIDETRWAGSAVMASNTRRSRSMKVSMVSGSKTSVRNSTKPPIPVGAPARVQRSVNENARSTRAVWVATGIWFTCRSPNAMAI